MGKKQKAVEPDDDLDDGPSTDLPEALVEAVLTLEPMQRASLAAVIAGSLATELLSMQHAANQLLTSMPTKTKAHKPRKTARR
jgi:hypothetical protein